MNEFSKLLHCTPSESETEFATDHEEQPFEEDISDIDKARVQFVIQQIEVRHFCDDITQGINTYREQTHSKLTKQRQQDLNMIEDIVSDPRVYTTKEACIIALKEQMDKFKTGWLVFKGKSRLKDILNHIIMIHTSPQLKTARDALRSEMIAHLKLEKKYRFVRGEELSQLKSDLRLARQEMELLRKNEINPVKSEELLAFEKVPQDSSFFDRFTSVFRK